MNDDDGNQFKAWRDRFGGRNEEEETERFRTQARAVITEISDEFRSADNRALTPAESGIRKRLAATLFRDLFDLKHRAARGCVRGSGLSEADSEWCAPLSGNDNQLGELRHPVRIDGEGSTHIFGWQFRMYFAAPTVEPALILHLVFGRKPSSKWSEDWQVIQDSHIDQARAEFLAWRANRQLGNSLPQAPQ